VAQKKRKLEAGEAIDRMIGNDPKLRAMIEEETLNCEIARMVYDARTAAGLTQAELARLIGTSQPAIARLEDADYRGHSLTMLRKIAAALNRRLEVRLAPLKKRGRAA
jgi:DNA-binding XRE family transcriptional regulator